MAMTASIRPPSFDRRAVAHLLSGWYDAEMNSALRRPRAPADARLKGGTVFDMQPEMSSTKAVRVLLDLSSLLGFEPSKKAIKRGGYHSKEEFVTELCKSLEQEFAKHYSSVGSFATDKKETSIHARL
jgi:hypothetical protein